MIKIIGLLVLGCCLACKSKRSFEMDQKEFRESFTGYDQNGDVKWCYKFEEINTCQDQISPDNAFAVLCSQKGHRVYRCSCVEHLCSVNLKEDTTD